jgi:flavin reductase (DIM6/NTAB) family NADH-FMN oxidoreductase RutF
MGGYWRTVCAFITRPTSSRALPTAWSPKGTEGGPGSETEAICDDPWVSTTHIGLFVDQIPNDAEFSIITPWYRSSPVYTIHCILQKVNSPFIRHPNERAQYRSAPVVVPQPCRGKLLPISTSDLFRRLTLGVYVIGIAQGDRRDAFTAASVMQISYSPLLMLVGVNPDHRPYALLSEGGTFAVSVLKQGQLDVAKHFGPHVTGPVDKLAQHAWHEGGAGAPILDDALAFFECATVGNLPAGDHRIILGRVLDGGFVDVNAAPLLYSETGDMDGSSALYPHEFAKKISCQ